MSGIRLLILALLSNFYLLSYAQPYDTLSMELYDKHRVWIEDMAGDIHKAYLIDVNDTALVLFSGEEEDSVYYFSVINIMKLKIYRSDFDRKSIMVIMVYGIGAAAFFSAFNFYRRNPEKLKFEDTEWLMASIATLVAMPLAGVLSYNIDKIARERYRLEGNLKLYKQHLAEIRSYCVWQHIKQGIY